MPAAQVLVRGEPNISYICSRYYRAPELIFGATDYTTAIDLWSVGCVMAELLLGQPLFPGESGVDQLVEIIKVRVHGRTPRVQKPRLEIPAGCMHAAVCYPGRCRMLAAPRNFCRPLLQD